MRRLGEGGGEDGAHRSPVVGMDGVEGRSAAEGIGSVAQRGAKGRAGVGDGAFARNQPVRGKKPCHDGWGKKAGKMRDQRGIYPAGPCCFPGETGVIDGTRTHNHWSHNPVLCH